MTIIEFIRARLLEEELAAYRVLHRPDCTCRPEGRSVLFRHDRWVRRYASEELPDQIIRTATDTDKKQQLPEDWGPERPVPESWMIQPHEVARVAAVGEQDMARWIGEHIARHDPAAVLADVAAKQRILARLEYRLTMMDDSTDQSRSSEDWDDLTDLASVYSDHPDYDQKWAP